MNERIVIGPNENLIEIIADQLGLHGKDLSSIAVIFPGKRPAHFLRKELARRIGGSFIPPKIFSIDEFVQSLYKILHTEPVKDLEPIDAVTLLYQVHGGLKERLGGDYFTSLDSFIPIGLKLFGELEELMLAQLPERRLKETLSSLTYNRLFLLPEYYTRFYAFVAEKKYSTRALRYKEVADHIYDIYLEEYKKLIIVGLFKLTHAEQIIFDDLSKRLNAQFIYQTDKVEQGTPEPEIHFIKASDTHGQVFALSAIIEKQMENNKRFDERSVIVLPTADALFPLVHQTLSLLPPEEYNIALGYPMARTPVYGFLHNLMEFLCTKQGERYSAAYYVKFVLHPYVKNIRFGHRTDVTRILFHAIESMLVRDTSKILITLEDIEGADEVFTSVAYAVSESGTKVTPEQLKEHLREIHTHTIRALEQTSTLKEFAHKNIEVLSYIYEQSTARLHPLFLRYAEALLQVFLHLEESIAGTSSFRDINGYFNFLQQYVAHQDVPFTGTPLRGLQVLGLLETRGLRFDDVYLLNANDDVLPGRDGTDMLLPQQLRESLGLETRRDRDALSEHYFNLLISGAKRVHIFYEESGENDKSRFVEKLLWGRQKRDKTYSSDAYIEAVRYRVKLASDTVPSIPKSDKTLAVLNGFTYSASALDTYIHCPIQFYYRTIMRLEEREEATDDLDNRDVGLFVHEVLKKFYEPFKGRKLELQDLDTDRMGKLVDESFAQKFGIEPAGAVYLLKRQIRRQLQTMLTDYQQKVIQQSEVTLNGVEERFTIQALGARFEGRIDRIEERDGKIMILDYKTGVRPATVSVNFNKLNIDKRENWSEAVTSLQLPIYLLLYSIQKGVAVERIVPAYIYLGESRLNKESEVVFVDDDAERAACFTHIKKLIELIIYEIQNPNVPFLSPTDLRKTCPYCPFTALCGTRWVQE
jgi:CRISPR/Cas system-associated exonuclease Cas4 (RecB family)